MVVEGGAYIQHADFSVPKALIATVIALSGIGITYLFYWKKIGLVGLTEKSKLAKSIHTFLVNKLYLDVLYEDIIVGSLKKSIANACYWINQNILDGVVNMTGKLTAGLGNLSYKYLDQKGIDGVVNGLGSTSQASGSGLRLLQSGKIQKYAVFLFMGVIVLAFIAVVVNNG